MHRNRTWTLDPSEWRTQRNRVLAAEGGDGSTLSLDFTNGILDSRFTFSRGSNATFVNSQGYVQYAASNILSNSVFAGASGSTPPTGWTSSFVGGTGSFTLNGTELTISNNNSATRSRIYQTGPVLNGSYLTVQFKVVASSAGLPVSEIAAFAINGGAATQYKVNNISQQPTYTNFGAGDTITLSIIPTSGVAATCLFGVGVSSPVSTSAYITIKDVQIEIGATANTYIPTTTSGAYYAPRFDYDPVTKQCRGVMIEGTATNYVAFSNSCYGTGWNTGGTYTITTGYATGPDGVANSATRYQLDYANATLGKGRFYYNTAITTLPQTQSIWMKSNTAGNQTVMLLNTSGTYVTCVLTQQWQRFQSICTTGTTLPGYFYVENPATTSGNPVDILVWGAQLELGSGASSYIPTDSNTVTRLGDLAIMNDITALNYSTTNGTLYWSGYITKQSPSYNTLIGFYTASDQATLDTFSNGLSYFIAARGSTLNTGGANEITRPFTLNTQIRFAGAVNTVTDPIVASNLNGSGATNTKTGTGNMYAATRLLLHRSPVSPSYGLNSDCATISQLKYWPVTKTTTELNLLTTT